MAMKSVLVKKSFIVMKGVVCVCVCVCVCSGMEAIVCFDQVFFVGIESFSS